MESLKIGFLPLDTRPCTYDMPVQLAKIAGAEVLLPPRGVMGSYKENTDREALTGWLHRIARQCDALVISVEQLLYGGLLQSREGNQDIHERLGRLSVLHDLKKENPTLRIYLSNVLMRTTISVVDAQTLVWCEKVSLYSKLCYREKKNATNEVIEERRKLESEIPAEILENFFRARRINHEINRACIRLVAEGIGEKLLLLQEDCTAEGVQRFEQEALLQDIEKYDIANKVFLCNGTDEAGALLLQKAIHPRGCAAEVLWLGAQKEFTATYEDRPFYENLSTHMKALQMREEKGAQSVLFIITPKIKQREASLLRAQAPHDYTLKELEDFCKTIAGYVAQGKHCYLLDVDFANGGNTALLAQLAKQMPIEKLWGYAAWNTASNALGTLLAQITASQKENTRENRSFTAERILDDALYQELVRQTISQRLKKAGENIYNIQNTEQTEFWLTEEFATQTPLLKTIFGANIPKFQAKLRWPRLFEIAIFTAEGNGPIFKA